MPQTPYIIDYPVRTQPDQYTEDILTQQLSVQLEDGERIVKIELGYDVVIIFSRDSIVTLIRKALVQGSASTSDNSPVYIVLQEQLVNVEPWMRIGISISGEHERSSCVMWATTEELRQLMVKLLDV